MRDTMAGLFKFFLKEEKMKIPQVKIEQTKCKEGVAFFLFKDEKSQSVSFPLQLSIIEIKQQENLSVLEVLEELWYEELLEEKNQAYLLPYEIFSTLPNEVKTLLYIPNEVTLDLRLSHKGAIGTSNFQYVLEKNFGNWQHLENTARQIGPWLTLADGTELLMNVEQYHFQEWLKNCPGPQEREKLFAFVAQVRKEVKARGIPLDSYLEKQDYEFIDEYEINAVYKQDEISLQPIYKQEGMGADLLKEMSKGQALYFSNRQGKKVFVSPDIQKETSVIQQIPLITGGDIPKFSENPEAFLPELEKLDLTSFGERVKSLGIRVYRAQPFVYATEKERGWFDVEAGFKAVGENGEQENGFSDVEIENLIHEARAKGEEYISWNGDWLKIPDEAEQFLDATKQLKNEMELKGQIDISKLPYILEIYENINHLEFNQPLLEVQQTFEDLGVIKNETSPNFLAQLKPFQMEGFIWMKLLHFRRLGGLLADDMGLGKTVQVLSFLSYLTETKQLTPTLIVAPKTLIDNWQKEMKKFAPDLLSSFYIHRGPSRLKNPKAIQSYGITITTYSTLSKDQLIFGQINWEAIICDEAQAIKNPSTSAARVIKAMKSRFRLALTGTPVENSLSELWSIMDFVQPGILGSLSEFKQEFISKIEVGDSEEIENALMSQISRVYKRRTKSEELANQLPLKSTILKEVPMGPIQWKLYEEVLSLVKNKMLGGLEAIQKLKALSSHPALINEEYLELPVEQVPKLQETIQLIEEIQVKEEKVLIFTEYKNMQAILRKSIREHFSINPNIINGMTDRRVDIVERFNAQPGFDVLILSPKAAGTGLTITSANHVIHYTRWWNPAVENQATDRVYRIGQEKPVSVYYPIVTDNQKMTAKGTVEQIVHGILNEKQSLAANVITSSKKMSIEDEVLSFYVQ